MSLVEHRDYSRRVDRVSVAQKQEVRLQMAALAADGLERQAGTGGLGGGKIYDIS